MFSFDDSREEKRKIITKNESGFVIYSQPWD